MKCGFCVFFGCKKKKKVTETIDYDEVLSGLLMDTKKKKIGY